MKHVLLISFLALTTISFAQSSAPPPPPADGSPADNKVFMVVEQMPAYPGGEEAMMKFIQKNIEYPKVERENDIQGRVVVGFIVDVDGSITNVTIKKAVSPGLDKEAMRVVEAMPKFIPGKQQGKAVRVQYVLPIMFRLAGDAPKKK